MNQGWTYCDRIQLRDVGQTVLQFYVQHYHHSSQAEWEERILAGQILLDGKRVTAETRLQKKGQRLTYERSPWEEPEVPLSFEAVYEDEDVLVVAKPAGLPVLPGGGFLQHTLLWQLQQRYPQETPIPIHRLGRGTSGLMLLGRSPLARSRLSQQMRETTQNPASPGSITKTYRALVGRSNLAEQFTITQPIGKIFHPDLGYVYGATSDGLAAYSEGRVLHRTDTATLLEITIRTGRPHQIRIHLASIGYPLLGDPLYSVGGLPQQGMNIFDGSGSTTACKKLPVPGDGGYHLHAHRLAFLHPRTAQAMQFICLPPAILEIRDA